MRSYTIFKEYKEWQYLIEYQEVTENWALLEIALVDQDKCLIGQHIVIEERIGTCKHFFKTDVRLPETVRNQFWDRVKQETKVHGVKKLRAWCSPYLAGHYVKTLSGVHMTGHKVCINGRCYPVVECDLTKE